jgi:glycerol-3-phosphate dehydrogenase (NAD(P)+)
MRISVLGAGAWGTAIACAAAERHDVCLWARSPAHRQELNRQRANPRYLPAVALAPALRVADDLADAWAHARDGLTVLAAPMSALRELLQAVPDGRPVVWLSKGFERHSGALGHEVAEAVRPGRGCAVLSGPSFALEVARGQPTALVVASTSATLRDTLVDALHGDMLRLYTSEDIVGVEVGGAVKNVLAIATGIVDGLAARGAGPGLPGLNARAALITRGLAEMTRLGVALGARPDTFMGLSGLGDLVLTATGDLSRNRRVGLELAAGRRLDDVLADLGHVAEGVYSAETVQTRARGLAVDMPLTEAVVEVLAGRWTPGEAIRRLMGRQPRTESDLGAVGGG